jgi:DNA-binding GntR family transcriptional regulator
MPNEQSLKDSIHDKILEGIFNNEYSPNQILNEKELVAKFGCSKSPVREALISLCNEGVLRNIPRCGYEIMRLTRADAEQIQDFRRVLECGMLRRNYKNISPRQITKLRELNQQCLDTTQMYDHWESVVAFHLQLMRYSQNQYAYSELKRAMSVLRRAYAQIYWDRWDEVKPPLDVRNHEKILDKLEAGDIDGAVQALSDDLNDFGPDNLSN